MARLDEPLQIGGLLLRNRLALPPTTSNFGSPDGEVTDSILGYYSQRARDVGMVIVEAAAVRSDGRIWPNSLGLWADAQVPGMRTLAEAVKREGAVAVLQINHAGARSVPVTEGIRGASPSSFAFRPDVVPTVLDESQIAEIRRDFAEAAARAAEAGFDGVEVHGAHFYLISQFLSPLTNRREDRYGGDAARRSAFAVAVVRAIRDRLGRRFPVLFRLNAAEAIEGGQTLDDALVAAHELKTAGVDAIHASVVAQTSWREVEGQQYLHLSSALPKEKPAGSNSAYAAAIKQAVGLPVITVGKLGDPAEATKIVADGLADLVAIGRQMIADPSAAGKILSGRGDQIMRCKECLTCFASLGRTPPGLLCSVNKNPAGAPQYSN